MDVLASLDWSGPARHLLESVKMLDSKTPAIMHIRHTARSNVSREELERDSKRHELHNLRSTQIGVEAAIDFGSSLPRDRDYSLYHTWVPRSRETADGISRGVASVGGRARVVEVIPYSMTVDREAFERLIKSQGWYIKDGGYDGACHWIAGLIPETILKPSSEFAKEYARMTVKNLYGSSSDSFHIYVSHDNLIMALIFHWFGVPPYEDGIRFLEGLLMQICDDGLHVWLRDRHVVYEPPYWWPN